MIFKISKLMILFIDQAFPEFPPFFSSLGSLLNNLLYNINFMAYDSHFLPMEKKL
jgi:hypothetical protein